MAEDHEHTFEEADGKYLFFFFLKTKEKKIK